MNNCRTWIRTAAALLLTAAALHVFASGTGQTGEQTVIRAKPDSESLKLGNLPKGASVTIIAPENGWYKIELTPGFPVWVSRTVVKDGKISASKANLRAAADKTAPVLGQASRGTAFEVLDESDPEWLKVKFLPASKVRLVGYVNARTINADGAGAKPAGGADGKPDLQELKKYFAAPREGRDVTIVGVLGRLKPSEAVMGLTHSLWEDKGAKHDLRYMGYIYAEGGINLGEFEGKRLRIRANEHKVNAKNWPNVYEVVKITVLD